MENFPYAKLIFDELQNQMPFLGAAAKSGQPDFNVRYQELDRIGKRLSSLYHDENWVSKTVRGYVFLSLEFLKLQRKLEETGRYLLSTEREALQKAYDNKDVFGDYYLPGLLLSEALWPNHYKFGQVFTEVFLSSLAANAKVLEVGVGTGYHLDILLDEKPDSSYIGIDISDYSISFANRYSTEGKQRKIKPKFLKQNISDGLYFEDNSFEAIIMGEIIEHIERPSDAIEEAYRVLKPGGKMFVTTVAFAANIDHIFMFENIKEIRAFIEGSSFKLVRDWPLPVYENDSLNSTRKPFNYAAILQKEDEKNS